MTISGTFAVSNGSGNYTVQLIDTVTNSIVATQTLTGQSSTGTINYSLTTSIQNLTYRVKVIDGTYFQQSSQQTQTCCIVISGLTIIGDDGGSVGDSKTYTVSYTGAAGTNPYWQFSTIVDPPHVITGGQNSETVTILFSGGDGSVDLYFEIFDCTGVKRTATKNIFINP